MAEPLPTRPMFHPVLAKQKFRSTRLSDFSGVKTYTVYVEILKKRCNAVGRTFLRRLISDDRRDVVHLENSPYLNARY